jgi:hypothetical protein
MSPLVGMYQLRQSTLKRWNRYDEGLKFDFNGKIKEIKQKYVSHTDLDLWARTPGTQNSPDQEC